MTMGFLPLLSVVLLVAPADSADLSKPVSLSLPAMSVERSLAELSTKAGVPLVAAAPVRQEILILRLVKLPLCVAMDKIASATAAEWQKTPAGFQLVRTPEGVRKLQEQERAAEIERVRAALGKLSAISDQPWNDEKAKGLANGLESLQRSYNPQHVPDGFWLRYEGALRQAPAGRAVRRMLPLLDPVELATLPVGERVVFSTQPTRVQRPLKGDPGPVLESFYREQSIWASALERVPSESGNDAGITLISDADRSALSARPSKILVAATRYASDAGIALEAMIVASDGKIVGQSSVALTESAPPSAVASTEPMPGETAIALSDDAAAMAARVLGTPATLTDEARRLIVNPEKSDPLSLYASQMISMASEGRHESLVACIPDSEMWTLASLARDRGLKPAALLNGLRNAGQVAIDEKDGVLTLSPRHPLEASANRLDRAALGKLLRACAANGRADVESLASFAWQVPNEESGQLGTVLATAYFGQRGSETMNDWKALRLYGSLSPMQRRSLQSGPLELRALSPQQTELVRSMVFGGSSDLNYEPADPSPGLSEKEQMAFEEAQSDASARFAEGIFHEATEALPTGLDLRGTLTMSDSTKASLFVSGRDGTESFEGEPMTAEEAAMTLFAQQRRELFPFSGNRIAEGFRTGSRRQIEIRLKLAPTLVQSVALEDQSPATGAAVSMAQLPQDVRRDIEAALNAIQQQFKDAKPGDFAGLQKRSPPP
jgi:hypothetical protein